MNKLKSIFKNLFTKKKLLWILGLIIGETIFILSFWIWKEYRYCKQTYKPMIKQVYIPRDKPVYNPRDEQVYEPEDEQVYEPKNENMSMHEKQILLAKLSTGVQLSYFHSLLGVPIYRNFPDEKHISYTYVDSEYYVWALTDKNKKVKSYSITSRDLDFQPSFDFNGKEVVLNKTPFSEWTDESSRECFRFLGAHDPAYYFESVYGANPGGYQTYWVGINNAAPSDDFPMMNVGLDEYDEGFVSCDLVEEDSKSTFNTIMVSYSSVSDEDREKNPMSYFGPNNLQTRNLNENEKD